MYRTYMNDDNGRAACEHFCPDGKSLHCDNTGRPRISFRSPMPRVVRSPASGRGAEAGDNA